MSLGLVWLFKTLFSLLADAKTEPGSAPTSGTEQSTTVGCGFPTRPVRFVPTGVFGKRHTLSSEGVARRQRSLAESVTPEVEEVRKGALPLGDFDTTSGEWPKEEIPEPKAPMPKARAQACSQPVPEPMHPCAMLDIFSDPEALAFL